MERQPRWNEGNQGSRPLSLAGRQGGPSRELGLEARQGLAAWHQGVLGLALTRGQGNAH